MAGNLENEKVILQQTANEVESLGDQLADASPDRSKHIQREFDRKMEIYWRQIASLKEQFPSAPECQIHEASFYGFQALGKFHTVGFMRRAAKTVATGAGKAANSGSGMVGLAMGLTGGILGGTLAIGTSLVAKQQEKANAREALGLLDKAIAIIDMGGPHLIKAQIYLALDQKDDAVKELDYAISHFPSDPAYIPARQMKDEVLTPKKKKWFGL